MLAFAISVVGALSLWTVYRLLVFTGDSLNAQGGLAAFREALAGINAPMGRYAVRDALKRPGVTKDDRCRGGCSRARLRWPRAG